MKLVIMKNKSRYLTFVWLFMLSSMVCTAQSLLHITSEERTRYQDEVKHFVRETYYGSLQEYIADDVYRDYIIEKMMLDSEAKYKPEFCSTHTSDRYLTPLQYLQELSRSYSGYEEGEISISVNEIDVSDSFFSHGLAGCYVEATYRISIQCNGKELQGGRCRMYCLFPNKAVRRDIRVLQVEPIMESEMHAITRYLSWAENYEEGLQWLDMEKKENYMPVFAKLAEEGCIEAQWRYGKCLLEEGNYEQALSWFEVAANQGHVTAQNDLGYMYDLGLGVKQDLEKAVALYRKAAVQGCGQALLNLGWCYEHGIGVVKDEKEAFLLYSKSSEAGNYIATARIAQCYYNGIGVKKDEGKGWSVFRNEVVGRNGILLEIRGFQISGCGRGNQSIGKEILNRYKKEVVRKKHCAALRTLGICNYYGIGMEKNRNKAFHLFMKSQNKDCCNEAILGRCYEYGFGVVQNYSMAVAYYHKDRSDESKFRLARCYENGNGVEKDYKKSVILHRECAEKGNTRSQMKLGHMYLTGKGVPVDTTEAKKWFSMAADRGNRIARLILQELNFDTDNISRLAQ